MNVQDFIQEQEIFLKELLERTSRKQIEYSRREDAFHNFKNAVGLSTTNSPSKVAWEMCVKHLQSLKDIMEDNSNGIKHSKEAVDEKIGDIIVYMTLIRGMLLEDEL